MQHYQAALQRAKASHLQRQQGRAQRSRPVSPREPVEAKAPPSLQRVQNWVDQAALPAEPPQKKPHDQQGGGRDQNPGQDKEAAPIAPKGSQRLASGSPMAVAKLVEKLSSEGRAKDRRIELLESEAREKLRAGNAKVAALEEQLQRANAHAAQADSAKRELRARLEELAEERRTTEIEAEDAWTHREGEHAAQIQKLKGELDAAFRALEVQEATLCDTSAQFETHSVQSEKIITELKGELKRQTGISAEVSSALEEKEVTAKAMQDAANVVEARALQHQKDAAEAAYKFKEASSVLHVRNECLNQLRVHLTAMQVRGESVLEREEDCLDHLTRKLGLSMKSVERQLLCLGAEVQEELDAHDVIKSDLKQADLKLQEAECEISTLHQARGAEAKAKGDLSTELVASQEKEKSLTTELKELEAFSNNALEESRALFQEKLETAKANFDSEKAELDARFEGQIAERRMVEDELLDKVKSLEQDLEAQQVSNASTVESGREALEQLHAQMDQLNSQLSDYEGLFLAKEEQLKEAQAELAKLEETSAAQADELRLKGKAIEQLNTNLAATEAACQNREEAVKALNTQWVDSQAAYISIKAELEVSVADSTVRENELKAELERTQVQMTQVAEIQSNESLANSNHLDALSSVLFGLNRELEASWTSSSRWLAMSSAPGVEDALKNVCTEGRTNRISLEQQCTELEERNRTLTTERDKLLLDCLEYEENLGHAYTVFQQSKPRLLLHAAGTAVLRSVFRLEECRHCVLSVVQWKTNWKNFKEQRMRQLRKERIKKIKGEAEGAAAEASAASASEIRELRDKLARSHEEVRGLLKLEAEVEASEEARKRAAKAQQAAEDELTNTKVELLGMQVWETECKAAVNAAAVAAEEKRAAEERKAEAVSEILQVRGLCSQLQKQLEARECSHAIQLSAKESQISELQTALNMSAESAEAQQQSHAVMLQQLEEHAEETRKQLQEEIALKDKKLKFLSDDGRAKAQAAFTERDEAEQRISQSEVKWQLAQQELENGRSNWSEERENLVGEMKCQSKSVSDLTSELRMSKEHAKNLETALADLQVELENSFMELETREESHQSVVQGIEEESRHQHTSLLDELEEAQGALTQLTQANTALVGVVQAKVEDVARLAAIVDEAAAEYQMREDDLTSLEQQLTLWQANALREMDAGAQGIALYKLDNQELDAVVQTMEPKDKQKVVWALQAREYDAMAPAAREASWKGMSAMEKAWVLGAMQLPSRIATLQAMTLLDRTSVLHEMAPREKNALLQLMRPHDQAKTLAAMPLKPRLEFLRELSVTERADMLTHLAIESRIQVLGELSIAEAAQSVATMPFRCQCEVLDSLSKLEKTTILSKMACAQRTQCLHAVNLMERSEILRMLPAESKKEALQALNSAGLPLLIQTESVTVAGLSRMKWVIRRLQEGAVRMIIKGWRWRTSVDTRRHAALNKAKLQMQWVMSRLLSGTVRVLAQQWHRNMARERMHQAALSKAKLQMQWVMSRLLLGSVRGLAQQWHRKVVSERMRQAALSKAKWAMKLALARMRWATKSVIETGTRTLVQVWRNGVLEKQASDRAAETARSAGAYEDDLLELRTQLESVRQLANRERQAAKHQEVAVTALQHELAQLRRDLKSSKNNSKDSQESPTEVAQTQRILVSTPPDIEARALAILQHSIMMRDLPAEVKHYMIKALIKWNATSQSRRADQVTLQRAVIRRAHAVQSTSFGAWHALSMDWGGARQKVAASVKYLKKQAMGTWRPAAAELRAQHNSLRQGIAGMLLAMKSGCLRTWGATARELSTRQHLVRCGVKRMMQAKLAASIQTWRGVASDMVAGCKQLGLAVAQMILAMKSGCLRTWRATARELSTRQHLVKCGIKRMMQAKLAASIQTWRAVASDMVAGCKQLGLAVARMSRHQKFKALTILRGLIDRGLVTVTWTKPGEQIVGPSGLRFEELSAHKLAEVHPTVAAEKFKMDLSKDCLLMVNGVSVFHDVFACNRALSSDQRPVTLVFTSAKRYFQAAGIAKMTNAKPKAMSQWQVHLSELKAAKTLVAQGQRLRCQKSMKQWRTEIVELKAAKVAIDQACELSNIRIQQRLDKLMGVCLSTWRQAGTWVAKARILVANLTLPPTIQQVRGCVNVWKRSLLKCAVVQATQRGFLSSMKWFAWRTGICVMQRALRCWWEAWMTDPNRPLESIKLDLQGCNVVNTGENSAEALVGGFLSHAKFLGTAQDPYVKVLIQSKIQEYQSRVVDNCPHPVFDESCNFSCNEVMRCEGDPFEAQVRLEVWQSNKLMPDELKTSKTIPLSQVLATQGLQEVMTTSEREGDNTTWAVRFSAEHTAPHTRGARCLNSKRTTPVERGRHLSALVRIRQALNRVQTRVVSRLLQHWHRRVLKLKPSNTSEDNKLRHAGLMLAQEAKFNKKIEDMQIVFKASQEQHDAQHSQLAKQLEDVSELLKKERAATASLRSRLMRQSAKA